MRLAIELLASGDAKWEKQKAFSCRRQKTLNQIVGRARRGSVAEPDGSHQRY